MNIEKLMEIRADAIERLMKSRSTDGMWRGSLSSSAISTAVSVFALQRIDAEKYAHHIQAGICWLRKTMKADGSWGDSVESPSNMTATLLTYVSLYAVGQAPNESRQYLNLHFGGDSEEALTQGVLRYYGRDLTFSVPILMMCALAGVVKDWSRIPPFPFELATLPQRLFRFLNLPVVSYAIPALIAIGVCQMHKRGGFLSPVRRLFVPKAMRVLLRMQPEDGGFLEIQTMQIKGVSSAVRTTNATLKDNATLIINEKILTTQNQTATTKFVVDLNGSNSNVQVTSRSVAENNSSQCFDSEINGNNLCFGHVECDAIIKDNAKVTSTPKISANNIDASLIHEAAIGKIAGEQIIKLQTLGLSEEEAEQAIIAGFLK